MELTWQPICDRTCILSERRTARWRYQARKGRTRSDLRDVLQPRLHVMKALLSTLTTFKGLAHAHLVHSELC